MGSGYIQSQMEKLNGSNKEEIVEETKKEVMNMLKKTIRPEFLNRIDETIMFLPLTETEIKQIVVLQIKSVQKMLSGNGVELELTDAAIDFLANAGYDPEFGARPVKRAIQHYLLNDLSAGSRPQQAHYCGCKCHEKWIDIQKLNNKNRRCVPPIAHLLFYFDR